jgi:hypothetical protein
MIDKNSDLYKEWLDWMNLNCVIMLGDSPSPDFFTGRRKEIAIELQQLSDREYELMREIRETHKFLDEKIKEEDPIKWGELHDD